MKILIFINTVLLYTIFFFAGYGHTADYYIDATSGDDSNEGTLINRPWKTLSKINSFKFDPGDNIYLKRGETWREKLIISSSGSQGKPIIYGAYGTGANPRIRQTERFDEWVEVDSANHIYRGTIKLGNIQVQRYFGALNLDETSRYNYHLTRPEFSKHKDQWFAGQYNNDDKYFYFRSNNKSPGKLEIGTRECGIYGKDKKYVIIENLAVWGPAGTTDKNIEIRSGMHFEGCSNIVVKNCEVKFAQKYSILFKGQHSSYNTVNGCNIDGGWGGIGLISAGNNYFISENVITNIGTIGEDTGDRAFLGVFDTDYITFEKNYNSTQGYKGGNDDRIDAGITFCCGSGYATVKQNYIKDSARGGILIGATDQSPDSYFHFFYNVVDGWGDRFNDLNKIRSGIYMGGGSRRENPFSANARLHNNLLMNGPEQKGTDKRNAAITFDYYDFGEISFVNNIVLSSNDVYDFYFHPDSYKSREIKNNIFFTDKSDSIYLYGKIYSSSQIECNGQDCIEGSNRTYIKDNFNKNPMIISNNQNITLGSDSICIDKGLELGYLNDYYGNKVPIGAGVDIGPFEFQNSKKILMISPPQRFRLKN
jgi:hypothetical protein